MSDIHREIKSREQALHQHDVRSSVDSLKTLLHPSFKEIGYSGTTYNLSAILEMLRKDTAAGSTHIILAQNFEFIDLAPGLVQVLYLSAQEEDGVLTHHAKRTSIWVRDSTVWKMQFHQATPTYSFERI